MNTDQWTVPRASCWDFWNKGWARCGDLEGKAGGGGAVRTGSLWLSPRVSRTQQVSPRFENRVGGGWNSPWCTSYPGGAVPAPMTENAAADPREARAGARRRSQPSARQLLGGSLQQRQWGGPSNSKWREEHKPRPRGPQERRTREAFHKDPQVMRRLFRVWKAQRKEFLISSLAFWQMWLYSSEACGLCSLSDFCTNVMTKVTQKSS